ncbi:MAG TPA: ribosome-associated translation inhibitor RaiA [Thermoguttaceae bacterium]
MQIQISGQNLHVDQSIHDHVERQMNFALGQFDSWINRVTVHLEDVNGTRRGIDKQCRILVSFKGGKTIKVQDLDANMIAAINRTADRLGHVVSREVDRRREKKG